MVERKTPGSRREPREGTIGDIEAEVLREAEVGVGKLTEGFREVAESDEDG